MPLLTSTEATSAAIAHAAENLAGFLSACVTLANDMARHPLSLSTPDLTAWLNARPAAQRLAEFGAHATLGEALNNAASVAESSLGLLGGHLGRVDISPVSEKLASQGRVLSFVGETFAVIDLPPVTPAPDSPLES